MYYSDTELNVPQVAEVLDCKETYVYRAIRNERIKALNTNRHHPASMLGTFLRPL